MKALIVEDDSTTASLLQRSLQQENHATSVARDSATALRLAEKYQFDAIILERMSSGLDGLELWRQLRRSDNSTPVLMLTARDGAPEVASALEHSSDDFLTKPFSTFELIARLRRLVRLGESQTSKKVYQAGMVTPDPAEDKLQRIQELWLELERTKPGSLRHQKLTEEIRVLSAEYQAILNSRKRPPEQK
jgi:two-component system OmpR family response regulator